MKYYIIADTTENKIMKVKEKDISSFKEKFGGKIVMEGDNIQDVLIKLSEKLNGESGSEIQSGLLH